MRSPRYPPRKKKPFHNAFGYLILVFFVFRKNLFTDTHVVQMHLELDLNLNLDFDLDLDLDLD